MASTSTGMTSDASTSAAKHRCEMCEIFFENETYLFSHYDTMHYDRKHNEYVCNTCNYTHSCFGYVRAHVRENHSHVVNYCRVCKIEFCTLHEYKNHLNVHKSTTANTFVCNVCTQDYTCFYYLVAHYNKEHLNVNYCEMCNVFYDNNTSWALHCHVYHRRNNIFVCNKCDYIYTNIYLLKSHASKDHTYVVKYCVMCDKRFYSLHEYKNHKNVHKSWTTPDLFRCGICTIESHYSTYIALEHHHKVVHLNRPCDMSDNTYEEKMELDERRSVSSEQSNTYEEEKKDSEEHQFVHLKGPFECKKCNKDYDYFVTHVLPIHSKVKVLPFDSLEENVLYIDFLSRNPDQIPK